MTEEQSKIEKGKSSDAPIPGNVFQRFTAWLWYGNIMGFYLGPVPYMREMIHNLKKVEWAQAPRRTGEVAVLTGGTRGIGEHVLKKLLQLDMMVIMGARNPEVGDKVVQKIRESGVTSGNAKCLMLDLKSLKSVRQFAENVLRETERIDLLVNNAGIMFVPWEVTEDNFEVHFHVNYLSHFLLTKLLLPKMKDTGEKKETHCRIVNVSSLAHYGVCGKYIQYSPHPKIYSPYKAYFESKFCQVLSTKYLNKLLKDEGANVSVYAVHPGIIPTDLYDTLVSAPFFKSISSLMRSMDEGAEEIMFTATASELENEGGSYIQNTQIKRPHSDTEKENLQKLLWEISEDCISKS